MQLINSCHDVAGVDNDGSHVPSSRSFDDSVLARPEILSLDSSIPEETAVEIADTSYAPLASPDEPPEHAVVSTNVDASPQDLDTQIQELRQKLDERKAAAVTGDVDTESPSTSVQREPFPENSDQMPNGKGVPGSPAAGNTPTESPSTLRSVMAVVAAVLICSLIGAIVMFGFGGTVPFSASAHAEPHVRHFRRRMYRPLHSAMGCRVTS